MITDLKNILALAEKRGCAVPAFSVYNLESVMGVTEAARTEAARPTAKRNKEGG